MPIWRGWVWWSTEMAWQGASPGRVRGRTWQRIRARVLAEEPWCRRCLEMGRGLGEAGRSVICDHIVPLAEGWMHPGVDLGARGNLAGMCKACHDDKTMAEAARAQGHRAPRARVRVAVGGDGWPRS